MSFVNVYQFVCVLLYPFGFEVRMWDLIVLVPTRLVQISLRLSDYQTELND